MERYIDEQNETGALNSIFEKINASKQQVIIKTASIKVIKKINLHYRLKCDQKRHTNTAAKVASAHRKEKLIQLTSHLESLHSINHSMQNYTIELNRSLGEQDDKNKRYLEDAEKTIKIYKDKWTQRKLEYNSSKLAVERTKAKSELIALEFKLTQETHTRNHFKMAVEQCRSIDIQKSKKIIIAFAKFMVDSVKKQNIIDSLRKSTQENMVEYEVLSERFKNKLKNNKIRTSSEEKKLDCNLPVKLEFKETELFGSGKSQKPSLEVQEMQTNISRPNNTNYSDSKPQPQSPNIPEKSACHNFEERKLDNPGSCHSQRLLFNTDSLLPLQKLSRSSGGENPKKLTQPKETGINEEKEIIVLKDIILKPVETSVILESMQMNKQSKIGNTNNGRDDVIIIQQMSASSTKSQIRPLEVQDRQTNILRPNNSIYTDIKPQPQSANIPEKTAWHNFEERKLDNPGSCHSQRLLFNTEYAMKIHKTDLLLPPPKLSSGGENPKKLTQPKETCINKEKKIIVLKDVILKPVETSVILENLQMNEQSVKIGDANNGKDDMIIIKKMSGSSMVQSNAAEDKNTNAPLVLGNIPVEDKTNSWVEEMPEDFQQKAKKAKLDDHLIIKNDDNAHGTMPKTIDKEEFTTSQMLPTKLFPDTVDNSENTTHKETKKTKCLQEKSTRMQELNEKYNISKFPEFTYGLNVKPKQKSSQSGNTSVSKFFSGVEIGQGDNISVELKDLTNKETEPADAPAEQSQGFLKPIDGGILGMQIDNKPGRSAQHKMETSTKYYGTQNTTISDYASLMLRYSDSQSEDDCSLLSSVIDFPMLTKEMDCLEGGLNIDKQFQSPAAAFGADSTNKAFNLFGDKKGAEKDKIPAEEKPQESGFSFLFGKKSEDKTNKGSFFNLFN